MAISKADLRREYLKNRMGISDGEKQKMDLCLTELLFTRIDLPKAGCLHTYLPRLESREPDTWMIVDRLQKTLPKVTIVIPRMGSEDTLEHIAYQGRDQISTNRLGIPEPKTGKPVAPAKLDMIVVPLLVADKRGYRLGYGKGFYDRFLAGLRRDCQKIGLSYFDPVDRLPHDSWDVALDALITPSQVYIFNQRPSQG